jgi:hypothetical protein
MLDNAMRDNALRPTEIEPLDLREVGLNRSDVWVFAPLMLVAVALPLAIVAMVGASLYTLGSRYDLSMPPPALQQTAFVDRWPNEQTIHVLR